MKGYVYPKLPVYNEWTRQWQKARRLENKLKLIRSLGGRCADCKCDLTVHPEIADFDHRPGTEKRFKINESVRSLKRLTCEASKCDLVCANCHRIRTKARTEAATKIKYAKSSAALTAWQKKHPLLWRRTKGSKKLARYNPMVFCACGCGRKRTKFGSDGRVRKFIKGHGMANPKRAVSKERKGKVAFILEQRAKGILWRRIGALLGISLTNAAHTLELARASKNKELQALIKQYEI
jgi:hypothetical protein